MTHLAPARLLRYVLSTTLRMGRMLASVYVTAGLLVLLAVVLAWGTILEARSGRELAEWFVYTSPWLAALLTVLGLHALAAILARWPWRIRHLGAVVTYTGILVLLAGALQTLQFGTWGQIVLRKGGRTDKVLTPQRSVISVERETATGRLSSQFAFNPGAVDWRPGKSLAFGDSQDLGLTVLEFYRRARPSIDWVADDRDYHGAAVLLQLSDRAGQVVSEEWLTASAYGGEVLVGPTRYVLLPISIASMLQDFLQPPADTLGTAGVLSMHYGGQMYRVRVDETRGKTVPLGESGATVEIVDYYPDAKPAPDGRKFMGRSDKPRNPVLELRVRLPGESEPIRQLAFAKSPLLNLDGVLGRVCPVRFWYHHAHLPQTPGVVFAQTPEGKLLARRVEDGVPSEPAGVVLHQKIPVGGQFEIAVARYLPRARREVSFIPVDAATAPADTAEAAALIELSLGTDRRQLWLSRGDDEHAVQSLLTPQGLVAVAFGYQQLPLGFTITLEDFVRSPRAGRDGDTPLGSQVKVTDPPPSTEVTHEISLEAPLTHGGFTFHQSAVQELPGGVKASWLTVTRDPGRRLKYLGALITCAGIIFVSCRKP